MSSWGINQRAPAKERIKAEYADYLHGLNSCGVIDYGHYSEAFDLGMRLLDQMYELGKVAKYPHQWLSAKDNPPILPDQSFCSVQVIALPKGWEQGEPMIYERVTDSKGKQKHRWRWCGAIFRDEVEFWMPYPCIVQEGSHG